MQAKVLSPKREQQWCRAFCQSIANTALQRTYWSEVPQWLLMYALLKPRVKHFEHYNVLIHAESIYSWQETPASPWWPQSCLPKGSAGQSISLSSLPVHLTLLSKMRPVPRPKKVILLATAAAKELDKIMHTWYACTLHDNTIHPTTMGNQYSSLILF